MKKRIKYKKAIKNNKTTIIIGTILILVLLAILSVIFYGASHGWFSQSIINNDYTQASKEKEIELNKPQTEDEVCTISLNPSIITTGDSVTGVIEDGKNTYCEVYATDGSYWRLIFTGTTNNNGILSSTQNIALEGTFNFRAICGSCVTNIVTLTVNPSDEECYDSDGFDIYKAGWVISGTYYYDECAGNWAVKEYYCEGGVVSEAVRGCNTGYICYATRSGGYCGPIDHSSSDTDGDGYTDDEENEAGTDPNDPNSYPQEYGGQYTCTDTDGGKNINVFGTCTSSSGGLPVSDSCSSSNPDAVNEQYCDNYGLCSSTPLTCPTGYTCANGVCVTSNLPDCNAMCLEYVDEHNAHSLLGGHYSTQCLSNEIKLSGVDCCCDTCEGFCNDNEFYVGEWFGYSTNYYCGIWAEGKCNEYDLSAVKSGYYNNLCCCWTCMGIM